MDTKTPWIGAAYYPEAWSPKDWQDDVKKMLDVGINLVRLADFAWSSLEPHEGVFELDWLEDVISLMAQNNISVMLCTPTAAPPQWLVQKYPQVLMCDENGVRHQHGGRQNFCPCCSTYRDLCLRIVRKMAERFGSHPAVIGWQVDNEIQYAVPIGIHRERGCFCPECKNAFHRYLKNRFETIDNLNRAWVTPLWSQHYSSFDQIPDARSTTNHHPSLVMEWLNCQSENFVTHVTAQARELKRYTTAPIGTDMRRLGDISWEKMHRELDVVQFNCHLSPEQFRHMAFWLDYCRPFKQQPFWVTEISPFGNGGTSLSGNRPTDFCKASFWLPIAMGAEASVFWHWREHLAGQEVMHGAVVCHDLRDRYTTPAIRQTASELKRASHFLRHTTVEQPKIAMHYSCASYHFFQTQPIVNGFNKRESAKDIPGLPAFIDTIDQAFYQPLARKHWRLDLIDPEHDLSPYKIILSPFLPSLEEANLFKRLETWIRQGGTWIVGPLSDIRDADGKRYPDRPFGFLEQWTQARLRYGLPARPETYEVDWCDGSRSQAQIWCDGWEDDSYRSMGTYASGPLKGYAAGIVTKMGKGKIVWLGTIPPENVLTTMIGEIATEQEIYPAANADSNLIIVPRSGNTMHGLVIVETEGKPGTMKLKGPWENLLDGKRGNNDVQVPAFGTVILKT